MVIMTIADKVAVSIENIGLCDCGALLTCPGIWGRLALRDGDLGSCADCKAQILPTHFGIAITEHGPERQAWLSKDKKWVTQSPDVGYTQGNLEVYTSML